MESLKVIKIAGTAAFSFAFVTALGRDTLRDVLIGEVPVKWMLDLSSGLIVLLTTITVFLFKSIIKNYNNVLLFFDSIGLGFFTVVGIQTGISLVLHPIGCIALAYFSKRKFMQQLVFSEE
ncbi:MAG: TRIC cation channel family protein [Gelidibacter sp.]